jgi:hemoglobin/transferrin/lactoferrin receptor protein
MKKILFMVWLLLRFSAVIGQTVTVTDLKTGAPLEVVTLVSENPKATAITNVSGKADISAFSGSLQIEIRLIGYKTERISYMDLEKNSFALSMKQTEFSLDQIVVSATRWNQSALEVPAKVATISAKDAAIQNPQTTADLLSNSGEVFIQKSQQGGGSPMIRGFATNRVLIAVDEVRMNNAIFRSGNLQNVISIDPFAVENTEVLFGPGSVIYGSDAIGGVMSFKTLTPKFSDTTKVLISGSAVARTASANNEFTGHVDFNAGWEKWAMVTSISYNNFGDLRMGSNGPDEYLRPFYTNRIDSMDVVVENDDPEVQKPTGYSQINLMQKFSFKPNNNWKFDYAFHFSTTSNYSRYDRLLRTRNGLPRSAEWYYGPQEWMMNHFTVSYSKSTALFDDMVIRIATQDFKESRIDRDFNDFEQRTREEEVIAHSISIDFSKRIKASHHLYYGIEEVYNDVNSTGTDLDISTGIAKNGPSRYPQATWNSLAAYLSYEYRITGDLTLLAGSRFNTFALNATFDNTFYPFPYKNTSTSDGALTGSIGAVYHPGEKFSLRANLSTGFRAPNVDDMGKVFDSEPGSVIVPNPDLGAEYAYNAEIGASKIFGENIRFDITGFYTILEDAQVRRNFTFNGLDSIIYDGELSQVLAVQNAAKATVYGIQSSVELKWTSGISFLVKANYQKGEEELDDGTKSPLRHAAPFFAMSKISFKHKKLYLELAAIYNSEVSFDDLPEEEKGKDYIYAIDDAGNPYCPEFLILNFKSQYQISNHFSVNAGVENIADIRYRAYSSGIVAAGRNFMLSLKASF